VAPKALTAAPEPEGFADGSRRSGRRPPPRVKLPLPRRERAGVRVMDAAAPSPPLRLLPGSIRRANSASGGVGLRPQPPATLLQPCQGAAAPPAEAKPGTDEKPGRLQLGDLQLGDELFNSDSGRVQKRLEQPYPE
jgi:hypothetical protein